MQGCPLQVVHSILDPIPVLLGEDLIVGVGGGQGDWPPRYTRFGALQVLDGIHTEPRGELLIQKVICVLIMEVSQSGLHWLAMALD